MANGLVPHLGIGHHDVLSRFSRWKRRMKFVATKTIDQPDL
jgi:hypothetical protein